MTRRRFDADAMIFAVLGRVASNQELKGLGDKALRAIARKLSSASYQRTPEVEDVFQEALLSMFRHCGNGRKPKSVSVYFLTVCRNAAGRHLTKEIQVERTQKELGQVLQGEIPSQQPLEGERAILLDALGLLPYRYRIIIELMHLQGRSPKEICAALGYTEGAFRTASSRAHSALKRELNKRCAIEAKPNTGGSRRNRRNPRKAG